MEHTNAEVKAKAEAEAAIAELEGIHSQDDFDKLLDKILAEASIEGKTKQERLGHFIVNNVAVHSISGAGAEDVKALVKMVAAIDPHKVTSAIVMLKYTNDADESYNVLGNVCGDANELVALKLILDAQVEEKSEANNNQSLMERLPDTLKQALINYTFSKATKGIADILKSAHQEAPPEGQETKH